MIERERNYILNFYFYSLISLLLISLFIIKFFIILRLIILIFKLGRIQVSVLFNNLVFLGFLEHLIEFSFGIRNKFLFFLFPFFFSSSIFGFSGFFCQVLLFFNRFKIFFFSHFSFKHFINDIFFFWLLNIKTIA